MLMEGAVEQPAPFNPEASKAGRVERIKSRMRFRGGIFQPASFNPLLDSLKSYNFLGGSPSKKGTKHSSLGKENESLTGHSKSDKSANISLKSTTPKARKNSSKIQSSKISRKSLVLGDKPENEARISRGGPSSHVSKSNSKTTSKSRPKEAKSKGKSKNISKVSKAIESNLSGPANSVERSENPHDQGSTSSLKDTSLKLKAISKPSVKKLLKKGGKDRKNWIDSDDPREPSTSKNAMGSISKNGAKTQRLEDTDENIEESAEHHTLDAQTSQSSVLSSKKRRERDDDILPSSSSHTESLAKKKPKTEKASDLKKMKKSAMSKVKSKKTTEETFGPSKSQHSSKKKDVPSSKPQPLPKVKENIFPSKPMSRSLPSKLLQIKHVANSPLKVAEDDSDPIDFLS